MEIIPLDIRKVIASFLDDKSRRFLRLANTEWFNIIRYNYFSLFTTTSAMLPKVVDRLTKYLWPISLHFKLHIEDSLLNIIDNISRLTNLQVLIFDDYLEVGSGDEYDWFKLTTLSNIEEIDLRDVYIPADLICQLPSLKVWGIGPELSLSDQIRALKTLTNLECLYGIQNPPLISIVPNPSRLKTLILDMTELVGDSELVDLKTNQPYADAFDRFSLLETLAIINAPFVPNLQSNTNLTRLTLFGCVGDYGSLSALKKLNDIEILWPADFEYNTASFLTAMTALKTVHFRINGRGSSDSDKFLQFLPKKVESLFFASESCVDLKYIQKLTNLDSLTIYDCLNPSFLGGLTNLTQLTIGVNPNAEDIDLLAIDRLIKLKRLYITEELPIPAEKFPSLELLTDLISIRLVGTVPAKMANRVFSVTSLEEIKIAVQNEELTDFNLMRKLTALKTLDLLARPINSEKIWCNLAMSTQLESLWLAYIDNDSRIENLVNLTTLELADAGELFTGESLTKLTALKSLVYNGTQELTITKADLKSKLTRLVSMFVSFRGIKNIYDYLKEPNDCDALLKQKN